MRTGLGTPTRRLRTGLLAGLATSALALAACSGGGEAVEGEGLDPAEAEPVESAAAGGEAPAGTLVASIGGTGVPDQFDPHVTSAYASFQVLENVYDTLVVPNADDLTFEPSLATEWTTSEDGLTWTFALRDDVVFHDGTELDAEDVVYSYDRIVDEELANAFRFANVESVEATDPQTVTINLTQPTPNLLSNLGAFKGMAILPSGAVDDYDLSTTAVGTGPFTLESVDAGGVELARFEDYWGEAPAIEGVDVQYVTESAAALTALRNGDIQWTDNVPPQDAEALADDEAVELGRTGSTDYLYTAFNQTRPPFDDPDVRRAIALAIDREALVEAASFGGGTVNQTAIPEGSFYASDYAPFTQDQEEAMALLEAAGVPDLEFEMLIPDTAPANEAIAEVMASQLAEIGVTLTLDVQPTSTFFERQGSGDFDAFSWSWVGNLDPFDFYHAQHITDGNFNFQGYSSPEVDALLTQAAAETDQDVRKDLYDQATEIIVDDVSYLYLYNPDVVHAWTPAVEGYEVRPDRAINFDTVTLTE